MNLTNLINTAGSASGATYTSSLGTSIFPTAIKDESVTADFSNVSTSQATITYYCNWPDHFQLSTYLLTANNQIVAGAYFLALGSTHPIYPSLYCDDVKIKPVEPNITATTWQYAEIACSYTPKVFNPGNPTVLREESFNISGEVISLPAPGLTISGTPTGNPETVYYPLIVYKVKLFGLLTLPMANILGCMNTVNSTTLNMQLGGGSVAPVAAGYSLYLGISDTKRTITTQGQGRYDVEHAFLISPIKHNLVLNELLVTGSVPITVKYGQSPTVFVMPDQTKYASSDQAGILGV
jgi:hypothetical protein